MNEFSFGFCDKAHAVSVRVNEDNFASTTEKKSGNDANEWEKERRWEYVNEGKKNSFKIKGTDLYVNTQW